MTGSRWEGKKQFWEVICPAQRQPDTAAQKLLLKKLVQRCYGLVGALNG